MALMSFSDLNLWPLALDRAKSMDITHWLVCAVWGMVVRGAQHPVDSTCHMGTRVVMQRDGTFLEPARMLSSDDSAKVSEGSAIVLCIGGEVRIL
jgi:hypothetical protein